MTPTIYRSMAWANERFGLSCFDNSGLKKTLLKMVVLDNSSSSNSNSSTKQKKIPDEDNLTAFLANRGMPNNMSLLKFFAINALELSAPASPILLQQSGSVTPGWLQLSGHPESIAPIANGIVRKRITGTHDSEAIAYRGICQDSHAVKLVPKFLGVCNIGNEQYIELQDLLYGFKDPNVMDIKMGCRTFLESEVANTALRSDLYKKMVAVDPEAPNAEEHHQKAITKLRYMMFREQLSSTQEQGFRIEALKMTGHQPVTDLKTVKTHSDIKEIFAHFLKGKKSVTKEFIKRLKSMRQLMEKSTFFQQHEIIGSSVFIVYDDDHVGAWLIDFAKARKLPKHVKVDHRKKWSPGNCEEGLLHGMDQLINVFEDVYASQRQPQPHSNVPSSPTITANNNHEQCDSRKCSR